MDIIDEIFGSDDLTQGKHIFNSNIISVITTTKLALLHDH